jgi:hypothetical protein
MFWFDVLTIERERPSPLNNGPRLCDGHCCAECGIDGGVGLKSCKACMLVKYCNDVECQKKHWSKHKKECKQRAAELRDEMLFKDPPLPKGDCPIICFLPMPATLICCLSLPPVTTITSIPIYDFANCKYEFIIYMDVYYPCCGKSIICHGCIHSFRDKIYPFCNSKPPSLKNSSRACRRNN